MLKLEYFGHFYSMLQLLDYYRKNMTFIRFLPGRWNYEFIVGRYNMILYRFICRSICNRFYQAIRIIHNYILISNVYLGIRIYCLIHNYNCDLADKIVISPINRFARLVLFKTNLLCNFAFG